MLTKKLITPRCQIVSLRKEVNISVLQMTGTKVLSQVLYRDFQRQDQVLGAGMKAGVEEDFI